MLGMLQILTYLLCVYLVFKGVEIFQIAWVTDRKVTETPVLLGIAMLVAGVTLAIIFAVWATMQAESVGEGMRNVPQVRP